MNLKIKNILFCLTILSSINLANANTFRHVDNATVSKQNSQTNNRDLKVHRYENQTVSKPISVKRIDNNAITANNTIKLKPQAPTKQMPNLKRVSPTNTITIKDSTGRDERVAPNKPQYNPNLSIDGRNQSSSKK